MTYKLKHICENGDIGKHVDILLEITATSLGILGNIHPNPNQPSECLHVMAHENMRAIVTTRLWLYHWEVIL